MVETRNVGCSQRIPSYRRKRAGSSLIFLYSLFPKVFLLKRSIENELTTWRLLGPHPNIALFLGTAPINQFKSLYLPVGPVSDYYEHGSIDQVRALHFADEISYSFS